MSDAPGWDAIDAALEPIYAEVEPDHYGTIIRYSLGGPDPLDGLSAYPRDGHFHIVSYGLTELYGKQKNTSAEESGYGFELTIRVARRASENKTPAWPLGFLQNLARYVFQTGNVFAPGHHLDLNGPIALEEQTDIRAVCFAADPELPARDTPNGKMMFLQAVGITLDELAVARRWNTNGLVSLIRERSSLLVTDLARRSILTDPSVVAAVEQGVMKDGSSCGLLFLDTGEWKVRRNEIALTIGATTAKDLAEVLPGRIPFDRKLTLMTSEGKLVFEPGDSFACVDGDGATVVTLPAATARALAKSLAPKRGEYSVPGVHVVVQPTQIRDRHGVVVEVIG